MSLVIGARGLRLQSRPSRLTIRSSRSGFAGERSWWLSDVERPGEPGTGVGFLRVVAEVAELANRTVHGLLHVGWVPSETGHNAQMAVLVQPAGRFGRAYLAAIKPFRLAIVYPMLLETIGRQWEASLGSKGGGRP